MKRKQLTFKTYGRPHKRPRKRSLLNKDTSLSDPSARRNTRSSSSDRNPNKRRHELIDDTTSSSEEEIDYCTSRRRAHDDEDYDFQEDLRLEKQAVSQKRRQRTPKKGISVSHTKDKLQQKLVSPKRSNSSRKLKQTKLPYGGGAANTLSSEKSNTNPIVRPHSTFSNNNTTTRDNTIPKPPINGLILVFPTSTTNLSESISCKKDSLFFRIPLQNLTPLSKNSKKDGPAYPRDSSPNFTTARRTSISSSKDGKSPTEYIEFTLSSNSKLIEFVRTLREYVQLDSISFVKARIGEIVLLNETQKSVWNHLNHLKITINDSAVFVVDYANEMLGKAKSKSGDKKNHHLPIPFLEESLRRIPHNREALYLLIVQLFKLKCFEKLLDRCNEYLNDSPKLDTIYVEDSEKSSGILSAKFIALYSLACKEYNRANAAETAQDSKESSFRFVSSQEVQDEQQEEDKTLFKVSGAREHFVRSVVLMKRSVAMEQGGKSNSKPQNAALRFCCLFLVAHGRLPQRCCSCLQKTGNLKESEQLLTAAYLRKNCLTKDNPVYSSLESDNCFKSLYALLQQREQKQPSKLWMCSKCTKKA